MIGKFDNSLRVRLLLLVAVGTIPALCFIAYSHYTHRQLTESIFRQGAVRAAGQVSMYAPMLVDNTRRLLSSLASDPAFKNLDIESCRMRLQTYLGTDAGVSYADVGLLDVNGDLICSGRPLSGTMNLGDQHGFRQAMKDGDFSIGIYRITQVTSQTVVGFNYPILDSDGNLRAVLFAAIEPTWFSRLLDVSAMPSGSVVTIINEEGTVLGRSSDAEQWVGQTIPHIDIVKTCLGQRQGVVEATGVDGIRKYYGFGPLTSLSRMGYVYAGIPVSAVGTRAWNESYRHLIWMIIALGISMAATWFLGHRFLMRKTHVVLSVGQRLAQGDFSARTGFRRKTEKSEDSAPHSIKWPSMSKPERLKEITPWRNWPRSENS